MRDYYEVSIAWSNDPEGGAFTESTHAASQDEAIQIVAKSMAFAAGIDNFDEEAEFVKNASDRVQYVLNLTESIGDDIAHVFCDELFPDGNIGSIDINKLAKLLAAHRDELVEGEAASVSSGNAADDGKEVLPGATKSEIREVMMSDVVGDYDVPDTVPEWKWVEENASFAHVKNGVGDGVWEFVLNLGRAQKPPRKLAPVIRQAREDGIAYLIFYQG